MKRPLAFILFSFVFVTTQSCVDANKKLNGTTTQQGAVGNGGNNCTNGPFQMINPQNQDCEVAMTSCDAQNYLDQNWQYASGDDCDGENNGGGNVQPGSNVPYGDAEGSSNVNCAAQGAGPGQNYYQITAQGRGNTVLQTLWDSEGVANLLTDARLHVQIKVDPAPYLQECPPTNCFAYSYNALEVRVRLKGSGQYITFTNVTEGECSPTRAFDMNNYFSNDPPVLEVVSVKRNNECLYYTQEGYLDPQNPLYPVYQHYCPFYSMTDKHTWGLKVHVSTDYTNLIPDQ